MDKEISHIDYIAATKIVNDYEMQEKLKNSKLFKYDQEVKIKDTNSTYYFKEFDVENNTILIANCHTDDSDSDIVYNDYWVDFDIIDI